MKDERDLGKQTPGQGDLPDIDDKDLDNEDELEQGDRDDAGDVETQRKRQPGGGSTETGAP